MKKRLLSLAMVAALVLTLVPAVALAATALPAPVNGVITLTENVALTDMYTVAAGTTLTLDLNGFEITSGFQSDPSKHIYPLDVHGTLTIQDSGTGGSISGRGIYVQAGAKLTVNSGSIYGIDSNGGSALYMYGGDVIINGGHIEQKASGTSNFAINAAAGTVTVKGGWIGGNHGAIAAVGADVVIDDGEFVCTGTAGMTDNVLYSSGSGTITINGGTFTADGDGPSGGCCVYDANGGVTINDGIFSNSSGGDVWGTTGTTINGGNFENLIETGHVAEDAIIINKGKTFAKTSSGLGDVTDNACTITLDANDGSGKTATQPVIKNEGRTLRGNTFTRDGYTFNGWNTEADGSGTAYADKATFVTSGDTTLYAQWNANTPAPNPPAPNPPAPQPSAIDKFEKQVDNDTDLYINSVSMGGGTVKFTLSGNGATVLADGVVVYPDANGAYTVASNAKVTITYASFSVEVPKTGDMPLWAAVLALLGF